MSNDTPITRPNSHDGPDIDGEIVPPEETAAAAAAAPEHVTPTEETLPAETASEDEPPVVYDLVEVAPAEPSATEPVLPTADPAAAEIPAAIVPEARVPEAQVPAAEVPAAAPVAATSAASMQTIYVPAPVQPRKKGNRGMGVLIAVLSTVIFAALYALLLAIILAVSGGGFRFDFLTSRGFYIPVLFFLVGFVIVVLIVNRASWWAFVFSSLFVALFVYVGTVVTGLLIENIAVQSPSAAAKMFSQALGSPLVIAAALLAREVSMWMGAVISARGRRVRAKNADARADFDRESAAHAADIENARFRGPQAAV
jgi:hypothetical protein